MIPQSPYRIVGTPPFPHLQWFKWGQWFKQWTGDNSKALMKASTISLVLRTYPQFAATLSGIYPSYCRIHAPASCHMPLCFWTSVISFGALNLANWILSLLKKHLINFILHGRSPTPTLHGALCMPYSRIWSTQWAMFLDYQVLPHYSHEETMVSLKSLWASQSDFANKPETRQAHSSTCMFYSMWDVTRRANDGPNLKTC